MTAINYYYNDEHSLHPFTAESEANKDSYAPRNALRIKPETKQGFWPCEQDGVWILIADHRGVKVYDTTTAQESDIKELGELPPGVTTIAPDVEFPKWNGKKWVMDKAAKKESEIAAAEAKKQYLLSEAAEAIAPLQDAVDLGMATPEEEVLLKEWRTYRVMLSRVDTSLAPNITWPIK